MKEIIVITQDWLVKDMKAGVPELDKLFICQKVEQVPETFADVKQLTKELIEKIKLNKDVWEIKIEDKFIYVSKKRETKEICFTSVGNMVSSIGWDLLMTNLTPARQWQIIKSLIGEE